MNIIVKEKHKINYKQIRFINKIIDYIQGEIIPAVQD